MALRSLHAVRCGIPALQHLLGAGDDVVLGGAGEHVEEGRVAGDAHDEVAVVLGMGLGV